MTNLTKLFDGYLNISWLVRNKSR